MNREYFFARTASTALVRTQWPRNDWPVDAPATAGGLCWYDEAPEPSDERPCLWVASRDIEAGRRGAWTSPRLVNQGRGQVSGPVALSVSPDLYRELDALVEVVPTLSADLFERLVQIARDLKATDQVADTLISAQLDGEAAEARNVRVTLMPADFLYRLNGALRAGSLDDLAVGD